VDASVPGCREEECYVGIFVLEKGTETASVGAKFKLYQSYDVTGGDLMQLRDVGDAMSCEAACGKDARCLAFTFDKWNKVCFTKSKLSALRLEPRSVSGIRTDLEQPSAAATPTKIVYYRNKAFPAATDQNATTVKSFELCEKRCRDDSHCVAFTFEKNTKHCRTLERAEKYTVDEQADSGTKRQEVPIAD
jgi:hypothetical protein